MNDFVKKIIESRKVALSEKEKNIFADKGKCAWGIGGECSGDIDMFSMFNDQLKTASCVGHYIQHLKISLLYAMGESIENITESVDEQFVKKFESYEINRETCIKVLEKKDSSFSGQDCTDEELIKKLGTMI